MSPETHVLLRAAVLALDGAMPSAVYGISDVFTAAEALWHDIGDGKLAQIDVVTANDRPVLGLGGIALSPTQSVQQLQQTVDIVFVPPVFGDIVLRVQDRSVIDTLQGFISAGVQICTVCAGAFFAAETGLFDGRRATTHWNLVRLFRERYPLVDLDPTAMIVDGGTYLCAGGVTAYLDVCLHILSTRVGPEFSARCARMLLVDGERQTQSPYMDCEDSTGHGDAVVAKAQDYIRTRLAEPLDIATIAEASRVGTRTLERRFQRTLGLTPKQYLMKKRLDAAKVLLCATTQDIGHVARTVGYDDTASFHRLFKKNVELTPGEYRKRFGRL
ncbi:GlxA family transcriptional regulator [Desulfovibrio inopinatus]|uniref:GlxA family transcriptional regulator n=1 Tax=Desulfovibrio inopinatus TaxID=102109 RepID=UPI000406E033|nr:helix-turn-helix domain-containing protein [Desulfovibrio inopinatus]